MHVSQHISEGALILVIIDSDLLGKEFIQGSRQLKFTGLFYQGKEETPEEVRTHVHKAKIIHAAGAQTITFLKQEGYPVEEATVTVASIPFLQIIQE